MTERLVFNYGIPRHDGSARSHGEVAPRAAESATPLTTPAASGHTAKARVDWAFVGLMAFTTLLFVRPQDHFPVLRPLHLADIAAFVGLAAMISGRLQRGLAVSRITPELLGVAAMGGAILLTVPFSIWPGGSVATFTDLYAKVILIYLLMVNTLTTPKRVEQFTWLIVLASGYIAVRAVFDYGRGVNLIENGRVQGAVGGIFKNPNDLALNMVAVLPLAVLMALHGRTTLRRLLSLGFLLLMIATVVVTNSRSGSVGLAVMAVLLGVFLVRRRPGLVFACVLALALALPMAPDSYWNRMSSITDASKDETGSREARRVLLRESFAAFVAHPLTGVGAGQFKNYAPEGRVEAWRETHNVVLQVAAELGIVGLLAFSFLLVRAALAGREVRRLVKRARKDSLLTRDEAVRFEAHAGAMAAALAGWFACAVFASVAYNWTFYYLLALATAPREILVDRLPVRRPARVGAAAARVQESRA